MPRYKIGSRQNVMYEIFEKEGSEACAAKGPSLNLASSTIKLWIRFWEREKQGIFRKSRKEKQPKAVVVKEKAVKLDPEGQPIAAPKKLPKRIAGYKFNPTGKRRVVCTYLPGKVGWLIEAGPEVSEVRWDDDFGEIAIINRFLRDAP